MDANCVQLITSASARQLVCESVFDKVEVLPGKLAFALVPLNVASRFSEVVSASPSAIDPDQHEEHASAIVANDVFATVDEALVYARFFVDFGPLDLGQTVRFCRDLTRRLTEVDRIVLVTSDHPHKRANVIAMLSLFLVVLHGQTPTQAVAPFRCLRPAQGFRDAACGIASFFLTVFDCARAVHKAMRTGVWNYETFALDDYEHYDKLSKGDINWIVPGKVLACSGPQRERVILDANGSTTLLAADYAKVFQTLGVSCVVRFNEPDTYDRKAFLHANIRHLDMEYPDGGNPTDEVMLKFIRTCERESGAVAVHCKAGLGRTGTNIAAFLVKKYGFTAVEAIAWCRICRPGSIVGPQQQFLVVKQPLLRQLAACDNQEAPQHQQQPASDAVKPSPPTTTASRKSNKPTVPNKLLLATRSSGATVGKRSRVAPTR